MYNTGTYTYSELKFAEQKSRAIHYSHALHHLNFKDAEIKYDDFSKAFTATPIYAEYHDSSKLRAIPLALLELAKMIIQVVVAIFPGSMYAVFSTSDRGAFTKSHLFVAARYAQSAFGRCAFIFNSTYGQYQIQKSLFYRSTYRLYDPICGLDFAKLSSPQVQRVFPNTWDFKKYRKKLTDTQIKELLPKLPHFSYFREILSSQLKFIDYSKITDAQLAHLFFGGRKTEKRLDKLSEDNFLLIAHKLRDQLIYTPLKHLNILDFTLLDDEKLKKIFCIPFDSHTNRQRLEVLRPEKFRYVFEKIKVEREVILSSFLDNIPENQLNNIDYNEISDDIFNKLFYVRVIPTDNEKTKNRLEALNNENFQVVCRKCKDHLFSLIPPRRLNEIDYERLTVKQLEYILKVFDDLSAEQIIQILSKDKRNALYEAIGECLPDELGEWDFLLGLSSEQYKAHYETLEIKITSEDPTNEEIAKAYKRLVVKYHTDKIIQKNDESDDEFALRYTAAKDKLNAIIEAYKALTN